jgi:hypothetical protein
MDFGYTPYSYYAERAWEPDEAYFAKKRESEVYNPNPKGLTASQGGAVGDIPDDVLGIIREFSRPLLRYPREYKEALAELGLRDWSALKAKLSTPEAYTILQLLESYLEAHRAEVRAKHFFLCGGSSVPWVKAYGNKGRTYNDLMARL